MRKCSPIVVVVVLALVAGPSTLGDDIEGYLVGEMAQLELLETPVPFGAHEISYLDGSIHTLAEKIGTVLLVNLWAKWCIPCRDEMLDFATLQRELGDDRFEVVTLPMKKRTAKRSPSRGVGSDRSTGAKGESPGTSVSLIRPSPGRRVVDPPTP